MRLETAQAHHIRTIAQTMRPRDVEEVSAGWGVDPTNAMTAALSESFYARTMFRDLEPLVMYGLAPLMLLSSHARFWIFATAAVDRHPLAFARACKRYLPEIFEHCALITNLIDQADAPAMRWMQWMGGTCVLPAQLRGGRLFAQFILADQRRPRCQRA